MEEEKYMRRCIQLAQNGLCNTAPNPMVGAVIVCDGKIIGEGYHVRCGQAHAEVNAIRSVKDPSLLKRSTIYVSLEPCSHHGKTPPCADLIIEKQIPRIVIGCRDPFAKVAGRGIRKLKDAGREVIVGVLEKECRYLIRRFITFHTEHRPYITLKWAESADGYIDICREGGNPVILSSPLTSMLVHKKRAEHSAIMIGTRTAQLDNPSLTVRQWHGRSPVRIVLDRRQALSSALHLFDNDVPTLVFTEQPHASHPDAECPLAESAPQKDRIRSASAPCPVEDRKRGESIPSTGVEYIPIDYQQDILPQIMSTLYNRGLQSLLIEGGSALLQSFINAGLWDEIFVEESPQLLHSGVKAPEMKNKIPYTAEHSFGRSFRHYVATRLC